jgi:hypothetical protein
MFVWNTEEMRIDAMESHIPLEVIMTEGIESKTIIVTENRGMSKVTM